MQNKDDYVFNRRKFIRDTSFAAGSALIPLPMLTSFQEMSPLNGQELVVKKEGDNLMIESDSFIFCVNIAHELKAAWWENKITGRRLQMGNGREIEFSIGLPYHKIISPNFVITKIPVTGKQKANSLSFELYSNQAEARVKITYSLHATLPVFIKEVTIYNESGKIWDRLLDVKLGTYMTDAKNHSDPDWPVLVTKRPWYNAELDFWDDPAGQLRGFPSYLENQFFVGLDHPSGFSVFNNNKLELHQHPGKKIEPKTHFKTMQAIYGVAQEGAARSGFRNYISTRMRRIFRSHDHPYAIIDTCGAQNNTGENYFNVTEDWCLEHISGLSRALKDSGLHFDNYVIEFWHNSYGTLKECDPKRFPDNFEKIGAKLKELDTHLGLWISSGQNNVEDNKNMDYWTIGNNPSLFPCGTDGYGKGRICRSTPPANQMYIDGFIHHIRINKIRQIKFDVGSDLANNNFSTACCDNPAHKHLPGELYSSEENHNAQIELLSVLDKECPDIFFTLYWGHYSPWWLLHGDTVYDIGSRIEMASHSFQPALFARSSNIRRNDQAKWMAKDIPHLGWDSLGVSLSDWAWNNRLGSDKWEEAVIMDMCRGSLLFHIWSDNDAIPKKGRTQMAEFISLLKARPGCFRNPYPVGNPFKDDYWGYCCTDGFKAMIAISNGSWEDQLVTLELNEKWGFKSTKNFDIYCWYPEHVKYFSATGEIFSKNCQVIIRPFNTLLFEVVPHGESPALSHKWNEKLIPSAFTDLPKNVKLLSDIDRSNDAIAFSVTGECLVQSDGWLAITTEFSKNGNIFLSLNNKPVFFEGRINEEIAPFEAVLNNPMYPAPWQAYRVRIKKNISPVKFALISRTNLPNDVSLQIKAYFIPSAGKLT